MSRTYAIKYLGDERVMERRFLNESYLDRPVFCWQRFRRNIDSMWNRYGDRFVVHLEYWDSQVEIDKSMNEIRESFKTNNREADRIKFGRD